MESYRELSCFDELGVRVELVKVPSHTRELGPPESDFEGDLLEHLMAMETLHVFKNSIFSSA